MHGMTRAIAHSICSIRRSCVGCVCRNSALPVVASSTCIFRQTLGASRGSYPALDMSSMPMRSASSSICWENGILTR